MTLPLLCGHSGAASITARYCTDIVLLRIISNLIVQLHRISSCIPFKFTLGSSAHMHYQQQQHNLHPDEIQRKNYSCLCVY